MDIEALSIALRNARKSSGLTQAALATRAGVSQSRLDAIENNRVADVGMVFVLKVAHALGLDLYLEPARASRPTLDRLVLENAQDDAARLG